MFFHSSGIGRAKLSVLPDNVLADIGLPTRSDRQREAEEQARLDAAQQAKGLVKFGANWISPEEHVLKMAESKFREHVEVSTDRFAGTITYSARHTARADGMPRNSSLNLSFCLTKEQNTPWNKVPFVGLSFEHVVMNVYESTSVLDTINTELAARRYGDKRDVFCLADGNRLDLGTLEYNRSTREYGASKFYSEFMWCVVSLQTFRIIASSQNLEIRLGDDELRVPFIERESMRVFSDYLEKRSEEPSVE